jgi:hypothetical protein
MGGDEALRGHRHGLAAAAAAAVAFVSISTTLFANSLYLTNRVANIVNFGFFRFPYHFSSR